MKANQGGRLEMSVSIASADAVAFGFGDCEPAK
jgi:hypothetical protein